MEKTTTNLDYFKRKNIKIIQKPKLMIHKKTTSSVNVPISENA
jgi:hypothetical protein